MGLISCLSNPHLEPEVVDVQHCLTAISPTQSSLTVDVHPIVSQIGSCDSMNTDSGEWCSIPPPEKTACLEHSVSKDIARLCDNKGLIENENMINWSG